MRVRKLFAILASVSLVSVQSWADFKYSETTTVTGGALVGMTKALGVFSKQARTSMQPTTRTVYVKGNKMRTDESGGTIQIVDLDGRRIIHIDPKTKTYGIVTFDDMKKAMQQKQAEMEAKMKEEQAKHPDAAQANLKITPKVESTETGATKTILGAPTKEVKMRTEMLMESTDPKTQGQQVSTIFNMDQWIAPDVAGYSEIRDFYLKMAKDMDWVPSQMAGAMANSNIQISMNEIRKSNLAHITGMPMLQYTSMTLAGNAQNANTQAAQQQQQQQAQQQQAQQHDDNSIPTNPSAAVMKGLGGMFGHKKDKQQADAQSSNSSATEANPAATPGSMMDLKTEVTAYSNSSLDADLFEPPSGYTEHKVSADDMMKEAAPQK
jgi:hypothetical protein